MAHNRIVMNKVIEQIRDAREERRISQWKLATNVGIKVDTLKSLEKGEGGRIETLLKVAEYLGYEVVLKRKEE